KFTIPQFPIFHKSLEGFSRCPISRTTREEGHAEYEESRLVCEAHDECQGDIQSRDVAIVKAADLPTKAGAPNRDQLVSHHVRPRAQTVSSTGAVRAWPSFVQLLARYEYTLVARVTA